VGAQNGLQALYITSHQPTREWFWFYKLWTTTDMNSLKRGYLGLKSTTICLDLIRSKETWLKWMEKMWMN